MDELLQRELERGASALGVPLGNAQRDLLLAYLALLQKWNKAYNLTAIRDPRQMLVRHLLDSLAVAQPLRGQRFIDVGTGGGLPGVPLSILYPKREFHLLDSNGKKTRFLFQVKTDLGLDNMTVHHARVEQYRDEALFDGVLSRAFASLEDMVTGCRHLLRSDGRFWAMKGQLPQDEMDAISTWCDINAVHTLDVPGLGEQRHLLEISLR